MTNPVASPSHKGHPENPTLFEDPKDWEMPLTSTGEEEN
jgi:hypothetical protein